MKVFKLDESHLHERVEWLNNPNIYRFMNLQYPITFEETKRWHDRILTNPNRMDLAFMDGEKIVAMAGLTNFDAINGLIEFYIMVHPELQGKGYGATATKYTINFAFLNFSIQKIYLWTNHVNERANKLYEKLGFQLEGVLRRHKFKGGKLIDRCVYGLLKEDWEKTEYYSENNNLL